MTVIVAKGSSWRYAIGAPGSNLGFEVPSYDVSGWAIAPAPFGSPFSGGGTPEYVWATDWLPNNTDLAMRQTFHLDEVAACSLDWYIDYDGNAYLDGVLVDSQVSPAGLVRTVDLGTLAAGDHVIALRGYGDPPGHNLMWGQVSALLSRVAVDVYDPDDVFLATIPAKGVKIRVELDGVGSGSFAINRYADEATAAILKPGNLVRVTIPQIDVANPVLAFFLETGDFKLVDSSEEGGEDIGFSGKGILSYWTRAIWLNESFLVPWWPQYAPFVGVTPPSTAIGAMGFASGWYQHYTVSGGAITSRTRFHTGGFTAYYDRRIRVRTAPGATTYATIVHLSTGVYAGFWMHAYGAGTRDYRKKSQYRFGPSILMSNLSSAAQPGEMIRAMFDEAKASDRPIDPIPLMAVDFTDTLDSNGAAWTSTDAANGVSAGLGDDYLSTIGKLIGLGVVDVEMDPDYSMHAYNAVGRDLTAGAFGAGKVRFVKGVNIADDLVREFSDADAPIGTFAEVLGPNEGDVGRALLPTAAAHPPREISVHGETSDVTELESIGLAELASRLLHSDSVGFNVAVPISGAEDELAGLYLPGPRGSAHGDYWTGDYVRLHTGAGENDFDEVDVRIAAITMWFSEAGDLLAAVEVGSALGGLAILGYPSSGSSGSSFVGGAGGGSSAASDLYQLVDERDQPNGYPSLDVNGRVDFRALETSWKTSVRVVALAPLTLSTGFVPGQVIDGVTLVEGDDVLVAGQSSALQNGIRTVEAAGNPTRRGDMVIGADVLGAGVLVREGTINGGLIYRATNTTEPVVDTDAIAFARSGEPPTLIVPLTNKSGASVAAGDVVAISAANATAFTTTTVAQATMPLGVALEAIANNATGRVAIAGYVPTVNTNGSTFGLRTFLEANGSAKQATANATRRQGSFGVILSTAANPPALLFGTTDQGGAFNDPTTTRGDLIRRDSGGALARLALGAANTVLHGSSTDPAYSAVVEADLALTDVTTANASTSAHGFLPKLGGGTTNFLRADGTWAAPSGGGGGGGDRTLLASLTASASTSLDFTTRTAAGQSGAMFQSDFDEYEIVLDQVRAASASQLYMEFSTNGGSTWDATAGHYGFSHFVYSYLGSAVGGGDATGAIQLYPYSGRGFNTALPCSGTFRLFNPLGTAFKQLIEGLIAGGDSVTSVVHQQMVVSGTYHQLAAVNAVRFIMASGNITSGTIKISGLK